MGIINCDVAIFKEYHENKDIGVKGKIINYKKMKFKHLS